MSDAARRGIPESSGGRAGSARLQQIAAYCVDALGVTGAEISVVTEGGICALVCASDDAATQLAQLQFTLGVGPSVDAVVEGAPVLLDDVREPGDVDLARWPGFLDGVEALDVHAVFAFPLRIGAIRIGSLGLHRDRPGPLGATALQGALRAADAAAVALLDLDVDAGAGYDGAPGARSTFLQQVHQATGMVQVQMGVSTQAALLLLRARAFGDSRPLEELASDVVRRRLRFTQEDR